MNAASYKHGLQNILKNIVKNKASFDKAVVELKKNTTSADSESEIRQIARDTLALVLNLRESIREDRKKIQQAKQQFETSQDEALRTSLIS